jgi:hypothetical protein
MSRLVVHKYTMPITDSVSIWLPSGAKFLSVGRQVTLPPHEFALWALVDPTAPEEERTFYVRGTGHKMTGEEGAYIATFMIDGGKLVFHVFSDRKEIGHG